MRKKMSPTIVIGVAALMCACGQNRSNSTATPSDQEQSAAPQTGASRAADSGPSGTAGVDNGTQVVTLLGCLEGPPSPSDTAATSDRRTSANRQGGGATGNGEPIGAFRLTNASASSNGGGVGANGAGASGGPLVSGRTTFDLDGVPTDARGHVNNQVRVTGRLHPTETAPHAVATAGTEANAPGGGSRSASGASATRGSGAATTGTTGTGSGSTGTPSSGSGTAAGAGMDRAPAASANSMHRRLVVERIEVVAPTCANP